MKSQIALLASVAVATVAIAILPFVGAAHVACWSTPPEEEIHTLDDGSYLYIGFSPDGGAGSPTDIGVWSELNEIPGLQTRACLEDADDPSSEWYSADQRETTLA